MTPKITKNNEKLIKRCISLARKGSGNVSPNPLVGCIITKNKKIIGKGYHKKAGDNHAEINAINDAKKNGFSLKGAELYVNLEPCSHYGKTPPCTDSIIQNGIKAVVIGCLDPNPLVSGNGVKHLKDAGIEVTDGVLENECIELNKFFFKNMKSNLPYVTLKIAQSLDGKIALKNYSSKWITSLESRKFVKILRQKYDAVLVGHNTAVKDNPSLLPADKKKNIPYRIILSDKPDKLIWDLKLFSDEFREKSIIMTSEDSFRGYKNILKNLYSMGITSILVEGGAYIFSKFYQYNLLDDVYVFISPKIIGEGISSFENFKISNLESNSKLKFINLKIKDNDIVAYLKKIK